jgi:hypothetical protein
MRTCLLLAMCLPVAACVREPQGEGATPPGRRETATTNMLEAGAALLQGSGPLSKLDVHLVGFHPMKDEPSHQMEAHHFCRQVNEDFAQCVLFDASGEDANLNGIEYIISERLFQTLPAGERAYWHPHNAEILSGQLVAPGIPEVAEKALMRRKMNSYGKTWHTWSSEHATRDGDALPLGPAKLAWSFNRDGQVDPALVAARDRALGISTAQRRQSRQELLPLARPQHGVDTLKGRFDGPTHRIPGVVDATGSTASPVEAGP